MIYKSKLYDYVEYKTTQQGIEVRSTENGEIFFISRAETNKKIRELNQRVIDEMLETIKGLKIKKCKICGKDFYSQIPRQLTCSLECNLENSKYLAKKAKKLYMSKKQKNTNEKHEEVKKITISEKNKKAREMGLTYGKYKALEYAKGIKIEI